MRKINTFEEWQRVTEEQAQYVLFVKTDHCSVCDGLYPQVAVLEDDYPFPFYQVNAAAVPELAGQLALFTAPVVLLFRKQKEFARFARIIPMSELTKRLDELVMWRDAEDA